MMTNSAVVELAARQLQAYNQSDLNRFVECYHDEVEVYRDGKVIAQGKAEFRERYRRMFEEMNFGATVPKRIATEKTCADVEHFWRIDPDTGEKSEGTVLVVYELREGRIGTVRFFD